MIPLKDVIPPRTRPVVTTSLTLVGLLGIVAHLALAPGDTDRLAETFGLTPADFSVATLVTSLLVHGGLAQAGANLLCLWIFGDNVEDRLGHARFLLFYVVVGALAALAHAAIDPASTRPLGSATGAVAGVLGGYLVLFPTSRVLTLVPVPLLLVEVPAVFVVGLWFLWQFLIGVRSRPVLGDTWLLGGVAVVALVVGFVTGAVLARLMQRPERARVEWWSP